MKRLVRLLSGLSLFAGILHNMEVKSVYTMAFWIPRMIAGGLSPALTLAGIIGGIFGWMRRDSKTMLAGFIGAGLGIRYIRKVIKPHDMLEATFGPIEIPAIRRHYMLQKRWTWRMQDAPDPRLKQNLPFWTISDTNRELLCDIWQPPDGIKPSGLGLIYIHGSGWIYGDKDMGTRTMFRHLAAQGHVCMDVAYRLVPEVGWRDMLGDVKRAISWMKTNGEKYGVDPDKIVVCGGSAGGHLALLAAYTPDDIELDPPDVTTGTGVGGVVSFYGVPDMKAFHNFYFENFSSDFLKSPYVKTLTNKVFNMIGVSLGDKDLMDNREMAEAVMGGRPQTIPGEYTLASPITHVNSDCPPTLLLQGTYDIAVKIKEVRKLYDTLCEHDVKAVLVEFPGVEHGFDLFAPLHSPPAQAALHDLERFLMFIATQA